MPESYDPLSPLDLEQFDALTAQEGHTIEGQIKRLGMIEPMIRQRLELNEKQRRRALSKIHRDERQIDAIIKKEFQPVRFEYIKVDGQLAAVIVEKSSLHPRHRAGYTVMMPNHVDTIVPDWASYDPTQQRAEPDADGRIESVGVWDEGQAVANSIAITADVYVPDDMRLYTVFTRGEEAPQSLGANAVIEQWGGMEEVDMILSSEIGPLPTESMPADGDKAMRYIDARPGRARFFTSFEVLDEARGHGSIHDLPNAQSEYIRFQTWMEEVFSGEDSHGFDYGVDAGGQRLASLVRSHPILGRERIQTGDSWKPWDGRQDPEDYVRALGKDVSYTNVNKTHSKFYAHIVPPNSVRSTLEKLKAVHAHIGGIRAWAERGIKSKLDVFKGEQSYPPFAMPDRSRNRAIGIVHDILTKVAGVEAVRERGQSVADENLYADELRQKLLNNRQFDHPDDDPFVDSVSAVISIPPVGHHSHSPNEWLSADSMAQVRHAIMRLLRDPDGLAQLATA